MNDSEKSPHKSEIAGLTLKTGGVILGVSLIIIAGSLLTGQGIEPTLVQVGGTSGTVTRLYELDNNRHIAVFEGEDASWYGPEQTVDSNFLITFNEGSTITYTGNGSGVEGFSRGQQFNFNEFVFQNNLIHIGGNRFLAIYAPDRSDVYNDLPGIITLDPLTGTYESEIIEAPDAEYVYLNVLSALNGSFIISESNSYEFADDRLAVYHPDGSVQRVTYDTEAGAALLHSLNRRDDPYTVIPVVNPETNRTERLLISQVYDNRHIGPISEYDLTVEGGTFSEITSEAYLRNLFSGEFSGEYGFFDNETGSFTLRNAITGMERQLEFEGRVVANLPRNGSILELIVQTGGRSDTHYSVLRFDLSIPQATPVSETQLPDQVYPVRTIFNFKGF